MPGAVLGAGYREGQVRPPPATRSWGSAGACGRRAVGRSSAVGSRWGVGSAGCQRLLGMTGGGRGIRQVCGLLGLSESI